MLLNITITYFNIIKINYCTCRSAKRTVRYVEADIESDDENSDIEEVSNVSANAASKIQMPSPVKKQKVSTKPKLTEVEDSEQPTVKEGDLPKSSISKTAKKRGRKPASKKKKGKKG